MKYNKEEPSFEFLPNEQGDADAYIARISGQRLVGQPDYNYSKQGRMNKCVMQLSGIVVETTGLTRKESKKAACAMMAPIIYGKHVEGKPIPLEYSIAAKLAAANGRPIEQPVEQQQQMQQQPPQMQQMPNYMPAPNMPMQGGGGPPNQGPSFNQQMMHQQAWGNTGPPSAPPNMPGSGGPPPQGNWGNQQAPPQQNYYRKF